jgi:DNA topoisomerase-1
VAPVARRAGRAAAAQAAADDAAAAAAAAGLRCSSDAAPGIRRHAAPGGFTYTDARGRALDDATVLARIRALAIPPAWREVWICPDARGHLQATGRDARGRKQYRYHPQWQQMRGQHKFEQLRRFGQLLPAIRRRAQRVLRGDDEPTRERVLATLVRLLDATAARIGNAAYARANGSYGLSTLRPRHVRCEGDALRLAYTGKSGVRHSLRVTDRRVAAVVRRCRELPGQTLFGHVGADGCVHAVDSGDVNDWLSQAAPQPGGPALRVTAKHFRTWHASVHALELLLAGSRQVVAGDRPVPAAPPQPPGAPASASAVLAEVARRLGNTVAVCRKAYVHPAVLELLPGLADARACAALLARPWVQRPPALAGLTDDERRLMGLLAAHGRRAAAAGPARGHGGRRSRAVPAA